VGYFPQRQAWVHPDPERASRYVTRGYHVPTGRRRFESGHDKAKAYRPRTTPSREDVDGKEAGSRGNDHGTGAIPTGVGAADPGRRRHRSYARTGIGSPARSYPSSFSRPRCGESLSRSRCRERERWRPPRDECSTTMERSSTFSPHRLVRPLLFSGFQEPGHPRRPQESNQWASLAVSRT
jgi:hypothetical protein